MKFAEEVEKSVKHFPFQNEDDEESSFEWKEKFNFRNWAKNDFFIPASSAKKLKMISFFNFRNRIFAIPSILIFAFLLSAKSLYSIVIR